MATVLRIQTDERFASSLSYLRKRIKTFVDLGIIDAVFSPTHLSITVSSIDYEEVLFVLRDAIAEIVVTDCKIFYLLEKMKIPIADELGKRAFVRALGCFDYNTDKLIVSGLLELTPVFLLHSFYDFCLDTLKRRWSEICVLANENVCLLLKTSGFNELLRYLVSNIESRIDEVFIVGSGKEIEILDRKMKPIQSVYVNSSMSSGVQVIEKLVTLAPRRIFLCGVDQVFARKVKEIFVTCEEIPQLDVRFKL